MPGAKKKKDCESKTRSPTEGDLRWPVEGKGLSPCRIWELLIISLCFLQIYFPFKKNLKSYSISYIRS